MSGNRTGGLKTRSKVKQYYGEDYYQTIGRAGGLKSRGGGFATDHDLARTAGALGGRTSRRGKRETTQLPPRDDHGRFTSQIFEMVEMRPYCDGNHTALWIAAESRYGHIRGRYYLAWITISTLALIALAALQKA